MTQTGPVSEPVPPTRRTSSPFSRSCRAASAGEISTALSQVSVVTGLGSSCAQGLLPKRPSRSEEHTSELQSLMRISYAVFCLKKKTQKTEEVKKYLQHTNTLSHNKHITQPVNQ